MASFQHKKVLIMGFGLNKQGSGPSAACYLAKMGAQLTITDLRDASVLKPTMPLLDGYPVRWVLGHHDQKDFDEADIIVKNPGVHKNSPYLRQAKQIETDLSLFLRENRQPVLAVTGSKGKSSIVTALHQLLGALGQRNFLGGNITVSPLSFMDQLTSGDEVVLELSSWQLGDLEGRGLLHPVISLLTNIMHDHQNYYNNDMNAYMADKAVIFESQQPEDWAVLNYDDPHTSFFLDKIKSKKAFFSLNPLPHSMTEAIWVEGDSLVLRRAGVEQRFSKPESCNLLEVNLLAVLMVLSLHGYSPDEVLPLLAVLENPEHRMEKIGTFRGVTFYNDSAATIPEATQAALSRFPKAHLIMGGSDKELSFDGLAAALKEAKSITLLGGTASDKIETMLKANHLAYIGPVTSMEEAVRHAFAQAEKGDVVLLSPGATSYGLFLNEFDRGRQFKEAVSAQVKN